MAVIVGTLQVDVTTNQATFTLDEAKSQLDGFGKKAREAGERASYSMREARESVVMTAESFGVRLPGGIARVIASIGPLGPALVAALPVAAIAFGASLLIEHFEKLAAEQRKAAAEADNAAVKYIEQSHALEVTGLKLDDQIAKLEGRPAKNRLKEAILESADALNRLATAFANEDNQMTEGLHKELGFWSKMSDYIGAAAKDFVTFGQFGVGATAGLVGMWHDAEKAVIAANAAVGKARLDLAQAPPNNNKAQVEALIDALQKQQKAEHDLTAFTEDGSAERVRAQSAELRSLTEIKNLRQQVANNKKSENIAGKEDKNAGLEAEISLQEKATQGTNQHAEAQRRLNIAKAEAELQGVQRDPNSTIQQKLDAELHAINVAKEANEQKANDEFESTRSLIEKKQKLYAADSEKRKELDQELKNAAQKRDDQIVAADQQAELHITAAQQAAAATRMKVSNEELANSIQNDQKRASSAIEIAKATASGNESKITAQESAGIITKRRALQEYINTLNDEKTALGIARAEEQKALSLALTLAEADAKAAQGTEREAAANQRLADAQQAVTKAEADSKKELAQIDQQLVKINGDMSKLAPTWRQFFTQMQNQLPTLKGELQDLTKQFSSGLNQAIAQSIVEGNNFGQAMRKVFAGLLEGLIEYILQWIELKIVQALFGQQQTAQFAQQKAEAASLAGANAVASWSLAPWPIDAGAPAFGAAMNAAALAFAQGGIVPGYGSGDSVPAYLTPGEMVLPKPISQGLQSAISGSGLGGSGSTNVGPMHINYAPHYHGQYNEAEHQRRFDRSMKDLARRRGMRLN